MAEITNGQLMDEFVDVMKRFRHTAGGCGTMHGPQHHHHGKHEADSAAPDEKGCHGHGMHGHHGGPMMMQMRERVLRLIGQKPGITADELAQEADAPAAGLQHMLGKLEYHGLIDVTKDGDKIATATLTDEGMIQSKKATEERDKQADHFFSVLTNPEKEELSQLFLKLAQKPDTAS